VQLPHEGLPRPCRASQAAFLSGLPRFPFPRHPLSFPTGSTVGRVWEGVPSHIIAVSFRPMETACGFHGEGRAGVLRGGLPPRITNPQPV
jgi:hypothetical protein